MMEIVTRRLARGTLAIDGGTSAAANGEGGCGFGRRGCSGSVSPIDVADLHSHQGVQSQLAPLSAP